MAVTREVGLPPDGCDGSMVAVADGLPLGGSVTIVTVADGPMVGVGTVLGDGGPGSGSGGTEGRRGGGGIVTGGPPAPFPNTDTCTWSRWARVSFGPRYQYGRQPSSLRRTLQI